MEELIFYTLVINYVQTFDHKMTKHLLKSWNTHLDLWDDENLMIRRDFSAGETTPSGNVDNYITSGASYVSNECPGHKFVHFPEHWMYSILQSRMRLAAK